jgi:hypothetical protein
MAGFYFLRGIEEEIARLPAGCDDLVEVTPPEKSLQMHSYPDAAYLLKLKL